MNGVYHEFKSYSPVYDCETARISVFDGQAEFFMLIPVDSPRKYRHARQAALDAIQDAIDRKLPSGEVKVSKSDFNFAVAQIAGAEANKKRAEAVAYGDD